MLEIINIVTFLSVRRKLNDKFYSWCKFLTSHFDKEVCSVSFSFSNFSPFPSDPPACHHLFFSDHPLRTYPKSVNSLNPHFFASQCWLTSGSDWWGAGGGYGAGLREEDISVGSYSLFSIFIYLFFCYYTIVFKVSDTKFGPFIRLNAASLVLLFSFLFIFFSYMVKWVLWIFI